MSFPAYIRAVVLSVAMAAAILPACRASDNPGEALRARFEAAKAAITSGDLARAEGDYKKTIALGLRQMGNLAISEGQFETATHLLDEAVTLTPDDSGLRVEDGIAWFRRGDTKKATELIEAVLASYPDNARAHDTLGRIDLFRGDSEGSIAELKKAVALEGDFETSYFLGIAFLKAKKASEAADLFGKMRSMMGDSAALHVLFGRAYTVTHYPEPAIAEFRNAIKLDPKYPRAHALLGYASLEFYGESFYPQARDLFEQELKIQPDDYLTLVLLGISTTSLRDYPAAELALLHATRLRPEDASPYLYLGETYSATHRLEQAVAALQKYVSFSREAKESRRDLSRGYFLLGQDLLRLGGREEEARKALARSQEFREAQFKYDQTHMFLDPQHQVDELKSSADARSLSSDRLAGVLEAGAPEEDRSTEQMAQAGMGQGLPVSARTAPAVSESKAAKQYRAFAAQILASSYNDLGVMHAKGSRFAEAAEYFKRAAFWNPELPSLDRNWGFAAYRAEMYSEAVAPLGRQLAASPDDAFVRQLLGMTYFMVENYPKTTEVLRPFLKNPPDDPGLLLAWGTALVRTHESNDAATVFRSMLEKNAENANVHFLLGQAYAQQKDYVSALSELKTAIQIDATMPEAHYYSGLVHLYQSDFENAVKEFRAELVLHPTDSVTKYHLGYTLLLQGQTDDAVVVLREVVTAKPDDGLAHFELGRALLKQGDVAGAIENLEAAQKIAPDRDATYFQLGQAYRQAGRMPDAEQALATYRKLSEASRSKRRETLEIDQP